MNVTSWCLFFSHCLSHWSTCVVWIIPHLSCWRCRVTHSTRRRSWQRRWQSRHGRRVRKPRRWHDMPATGRKKWQSTLVTKPRRLRDRLASEQRKWRAMLAKSVRRWRGRLVTAQKRWHVMRARSVKLWHGRRGLWFTTTTCRNGSRTTSFWRRDIGRSSVHSLLASGQFSVFTPRQATSGLTC